ncbi:hypothetical protein [Pseudotamlana agarivorans]|uniref:hypothetical protein n=1 Tax=Pseudotamlana agarivorans TaxID=481183 RepID=UPI00082C40B1|nr:hypothetical protein [Tamlana agarivorans]
MISCLFNQGRIKKRMSFIILVFYVSIKLTGVHAFFHTDDNGDMDNCHVCEYAITTNLTPALAPSLLYHAIELEIPSSCNSIQITYVNTVVITLLTSQLVSRPPPGFI